MSNRAEFMKEVHKMMEAVKDLSPDKLLFTYNGKLYPTATCSPETFQAMGSFEAREDDVLMVAYPKCGSNWTLHLLHQMVKAAYNLHPPAMLPMLEFGAPNKYEKLKEQPSPRVFASHLFYDDIPKSFFEKKVKMLVVFRNPKDTAVSLFHFHNSNPTLPTYSSWDTFFQDFINGKVCLGSYFDHALQWNKHIEDETVFIITYEEMKQDLKAAVQKISNFLRIPLSEEQIQQIAEKGTFASMKENAKDTHGPMGNVIFRKGDIGDWKNHFSEAQSQEVDAKFEECLAGTKLGEMLNYNVYCKQ
ncbi:sulfotransferase 6B1-like [Discoglossus pictus]